MADLTARKYYTYKLIDPDHGVFLCWKRLW